MKNKLLLLAAVLLTTLSTRAVDEIEEGVEYYILDEETGFFLGAQNNWGCRSAITEDAGIFVFEAGQQREDGWNIRNTRMSSTWYYGTDLYMDKGAGSDLATIVVKDNEEAGTTKRVDGIWDIHNLGGGYFKFSMPGNWSYVNGEWVQATDRGYIAKGDAGYRKGFNIKFTQNATEALTFMVLTPEEALQYVMDKAQTSNVSYNFLVSNPDFCRNNAGWSGNPGIGGDSNGDYNAESYMSTFDVSQTIDIPNGEYTVTAYGAVTFHDNRTIKPYDGNGYPTFTVNGQTFDFYEMDDADKLSSQTKIGQSFHDGKYKIGPITVNVTDGQMTFNFKSTRNDIWAVYDNVQIQQFNNVVEYAQEKLASITYPIEGIGSADVQSTYEDAYTTFKNWVNGLQPGDATLEQVDIKYGEFVVAEDAWKASIEKWSAYTTAADKAKKLYTQIASQEGKFIPSGAWHAFGVYINGAPELPGYQDAGYTFVNGNYAYIMEVRNLDDAGITAEVAFLNTLMNDVKKTVVQPGMDVTFLLVNPDFNDPTGAGWVREQTGGNKTNYGGITGWPVAEAWNASSLDFYQIVEDAPAGLYRVSVNAFYRSPGRTLNEPVTAKLYMGTFESPIASLYNPDYIVEKDLTWNEEQQQWIGTIAKNGTNCFYWNGDEWAGITNADKEKIWTYNENEDLDIRNRIQGSTGINGDGYLGTDVDYEVGGKTYLVPDGMQGASIAFSAGRYPMTVKGEVTENEPGSGVGTLRIGVKGNTSGAAWALWSNFRLELLGEDAETMREQLGEILGELKANPLLPQEDVAQGVQEIFMNDTVLAKIPEYEALADPESALQDYAVYKAAYDDVAYMNNKLTDVYKVEIDKFYATQAELEELIGGYDGDEDVKQYATNVKAVYENLVGLETGALVSLTDEDMENLIQYYLANEYGDPQILTKATIQDPGFDPDEAFNYAYTSTFGEYYKLVDELRMMLGSIRINITTPEFENVTSQLINPDFLNDTQWSGTAANAINVNDPGSGEWFSMILDAYQPLWLPEGYYTFVSYAQDRRTDWKTAIEGVEDEDIDYATYMYANVGRGNEPEDTLAVTTQNARFVTLTTDITDGAGSIATYVVDPEGANVTWYTPNSMDQFNAWMTARRENETAIGGKALQFYVPAGGAYTSIGFYRRQIQSNSSWFICDEIQLFYSADGYPTPTGVDALPASVENFGKPNGKYIEKDRIVIYSNGNKFNVAGQIIK